MIIVILSIVAYASIATFIVSSIAANERLRNALSDSWVDVSHDLEKGAIGKYQEQIVTLISSIYRDGNGNIKKEKILLVSISLNMMAWSSLFVLFADDSDFDGFMFLMALAIAISVSFFMEYATFLITVFIVNKIGKRNLSLAILVDIFVVIVLIMLVAFACIFLRNYIVIEDSSIFYLPMINEFMTYLVMAISPVVVVFISFVAMSEGYGSGSAVFYTVSAAFSLSSISICLPSLLFALGYSSIRNRAMYRLVKNTIESFMSWDAEKTRQRSFIVFGVSASLVTVVSADAFSLL